MIVKAWLNTASITAKGVVDLPLTVITLKKTPASLRGDLTKWMQEIATGVYIGNFNTRVRAHLWQRVTENVGVGEATMSYSYRNEIGYRFETWQTDRHVIDYEGIPLVLIPSAEDERPALKKGFSRAAHHHQAKKHQTSRSNAQSEPTYVVIDLETDGLDAAQNAIIEIGAVKVGPEGTQTFSALLAHDGQLPKQIEQLTGIDQTLLDRKGQPLEQVLVAFKAFIGEHLLVGYNINFDLRFLQQAFIKCQLTPIANKSIDLKALVKKEKPLLENYQLQTVLQAYGVSEQVQHRALSDAKQTHQLASKVNKFRDQFK